MNLLSGILLESWAILVESAPYVLFGFFAAGLLKAFLPGELVARQLGQNNSASIIKAALFGIPLPLCSCGVIPAAIELRRQGASKGSTAAFLVSVPETGVDSIAITWALLDPLMTIIRPIASFVTAILTGLFINRLPETSPPAWQVPLQKPSCGCPATPDGSSPSPPRLTLFQRVRSGLSYAFGELLGDIGKWLLLGILIAGLISSLIPDDFFLRYLTSESLSLLIMLVIGIPIYICASASTPVAAALVLKGLSPGAALVFLLAGPATNAATLTVVARYFGKLATLIYVASIAICSLLLGWLTNRIYLGLGLDISAWANDAAELSNSTFMQITAILLLLLIGFNLIRTKLEKR